jgi:hypothetical protein
MKAALLLVAAAVAGGCSTNDVSLSILGMEALTRMNMCNITPTATVLRDRGRLDVSQVTTSGYIAVPVVRNNLPSNVNGVEFNAIQLIGVNIKLMNVDGSTLVPPGLYNSAGGRLDPGGTAAMSVEVLPASVATTLPIPSGGLYTVIAEVKPVGMRSSDQVVGGPIDFPIDVCNGCLVENLGACPLPKGTMLPCLDQQDDPTVCCTDATQAQLCNEKAPIAM